MNLTNLKETKKLYVYVLMLFGIILLIRSKYSFCWSDESFYLTFAQRLWNGQQLIVDEWHPTQFYSVILFPLLSLYHLLFGNNGIYLFVRILIIVLSLITSIFLYFTLCKRTSCLLSFICSSFYLLYSRGNIWGYSYYNLFLTFCVLMLCFAENSRNGKLSKLFLIISGICASFAVLCMPYFAIFLLIAIFIGLCVKRTRKESFFVLIGVFITAVYFLLFYFPKDLSNALINLKQIINDPEHVSGLFYNLYVSMSDATRRYLFEIIFLFLFLIIEKCLLLKNKYFKFKIVLYFCAMLISYIAHMNDETGFTLYTFACFSTALIILLNFNKNIDCFALSLMILGILTSLSMAMGSNTYSIAFSVGMPIYAMGIVLQFDKLQITNKTISDMFILFCFVTISFMFLSRITYVYRDDNLQELNVKLDRGVAEGLYTSNEHAEQYYQVIDMIEDLENKYDKSNTIFFTKILPWGYVQTNFKCGAPTAWRTPLNSARLKDYYEIHENLIPSIVVVLKDDMGKYSYDQRPNENVYDGWLLEYMVSNNYQHYSYSCADVYVSSKIEEN